MAGETPAIAEAHDTPEDSAAELKRARIERGRKAQEARLRDQLAKLAEHQREERRRWEREVELRNREEDRGVPPGWAGEIAFGPGTTVEVRDAIEGT